MGTASFSRGRKAAGAWRWQINPSSANAKKKRVQLHLYYPSEPSWSVTGWAFPLRAEFKFLPHRKKQFPARDLSVYGNFCLFRPYQNNGHTVFKIQKVMQAARSKLFTITTHGSQLQLGITTGRVRTFHISFISYGIRVGTFDSATTTRTVT